MVIAAATLFLAGLMIDIWFSQRLGQTSFLLLMVAGVISLFKNFYPKKVSRQIKLK